MLSFVKGPEDSVQVNFLFFLENGEKKKKRYFKKRMKNNGFSCVLSIL